MSLKKIIFTCYILFLCVSVFAQDKALTKDSILDKYQYDKKVQQLICVDYVADSNAILKMYVKDKQDNFNWKLILATDAFVGKNGIGKEREGDSKTPTGEFNVIKAFGTKDNPGTKLKYIKVNDDMYACDENCKYYNQIINVKKVKHQCAGEYLKKYIEYVYALCIDYNKENIYPKGSNIFIHVKGNKMYTAGCVAVDEDSMITILKNSTKKTKVVIK